MTKHPPRYYRRQALIRDIILFVSLGFGAGIATILAIWRLI